MVGMRVYAALVAAMFLWGFAFIGTKIALLSFSPIALMFYRFAIAAVLFFLYFLIKGFPRFTRKQHFQLFIISFFEPGLYFALETYGLRLTSASKGSLIIASVPIAVLILSRIFLKEKISIRGAAGIVLSILGIAVLVLGGNARDILANSSLFGDLLVLGAAVAAACYILLARDLGRSVSAVGITGFQVFYGAAFFAPFYFFGKGQASPVLPASVLALGFLAVGATIGAFLSYNYALGRISASRASIFINGIPVVTALGAWIILGETLTPLQILGAAVVIAAVYLTSFSSPALAEETEPTLVG